MVSNGLDKDFTQTTSKYNLLFVFLLDGFLTLENVSWDMEGIYRCQAPDYHRAIKLNRPHSLPINTPLELVVIIPIGIPRIELDGIGIDDLEMKEGDQVVNLTCTSAGRKPGPSVR